MPSVSVGRVQVIALLVVLAVGVAAGVVASAALITRASDPLVVTDDTEPSLIDVQVVDFGRSIPISVEVNWRSSTIFAPAPQGIATKLPMTSLFTAADGLELMRIDDRPVVLAVADLPSYRDMALGDQGADIQQLQEFLVRMGLLEEQSVDGRFGTATASAVETLFTDYGSVASRSVPLGQVIFLPPGRYSLQSKVALGQQVSEPLDLARLDSAGPTMTGTIAPLAELAVGLKVYVEGLEHPLQVSELLGTSEEGDAELLLAARNGGPPCPAETCPLTVPVSLQALAQGRIQIVPETSGRAVPASAIGTNAGGEPVVYDAAGTPWVVQPQLSQDGFILVGDSLPADIDRVQLAADPQSEAG